MYPITTISQASSETYEPGKELLSKEFGHINVSSKTVILINPINNYILSTGLNMSSTNCTLISQPPIKIYGKNIIPFTTTISCICTLIITLLVTSIGGN